MKLRARAVYPCPLYLSLYLALSFSLFRSTKAVGLLSPAHNTYMPSLARSLSFSLISLRGMNYGHRMREREGERMMRDGMMRMM